MTKFDPEKFICKKCGECCRGEGFVKVTEDEIRKMADYLGESPEEFKKNWIKSSLFEGYWLKEKPNRDCIFLENNMCKVHPVKPEQCRNFPFSWNNSDSIITCPALREIREKS